MNTTLISPKKIIQRPQYVGDFDPVKWERCKRSFGADFEKRVLGRSSRDYVKKYGLPRHVPFQEALETASMSHLHWNPREGEHSSPAYRMLRAVEMEFFFEYGFVPKIEMYRCVGTAADIYHGVDCFFCIDGTSSIALIDLTQNTEKVREKARRFVYLRPEDLEEPKLQQFAKRVMRILMLPMKLKQVTFKQFV